MRKREIELIRNSVLFKKLTDSDWLQISDYFNSEPQLFETGSIIYSPAHYLRSLGIVLKGSAIVKRENGTLMSILSPGDFFGIPVLYSDKPFPTEIEAKSECSVLFIEREEFTVMMNSVPRLTEIFCGYLSDRILFLNDRLDSISFANSDDRLYAYLVSYSSKIGDATFSLPVSFSDLSSILSIGRTSLYRSFDNLQVKGLLIKNEKQITLI